MKWFHGGMYLKISAHAQNLDWTCTLKRAPKFNNNFTLIFTTQNMLCVNFKFPAVPVQYSYVRDAEVQKAATRWLSEQYNSTHLASLGSNMKDTSEVQCKTSITQRKKYISTVFVKVSKSGILTDKTCKCQ